MNAKDRVSDVRPYVERALKDEEVRDHVKSAFLSAKDVYTDLLGGRGAVAVAARAATDEDIHDKLREALDELRSAADRSRPRRTTPRATSCSSCSGSCSESCSTRSPAARRATG